MDIIKLC